MLRKYQLNKIVDCIEKAKYFISPFLFILKN